jgi:hypothetical protein
MDWLQRPVSGAWAIPHADILVVAVEDVNAIIDHGMMKCSAGGVGYNLREFFQPRVIEVWKRFFSERFKLGYADCAQRVFDGLAPFVHDLFEVPVFDFNKCV